MSYFAIVVVVAADDAEQARGFVSDQLDTNALVDPVEFVGEPWAVYPIRPNPIGRSLAEGYVPEFSTDDCIRQYDREPAF